MRLSERAIELPRLVLLGSVLFCGIGLVAVFTLPKERTPRVKLPVIVVAVPNPGATPDTNERSIVRKLEPQLAEMLDNLRDEGAIKSQAVTGAAIFQIIFADGTNVREARIDVESIVDRVRPEFPVEAQTNPGPQVNDIAFEEFPIIQAVIAGGADGAERRRIAERLESRIKKVKGVAGVDIFGGFEREVHVEVDPNLMVLYGFGYEDLRKAIRRANEDSPTGEIDTVAGHKMRVRTSSKLASLEDIKHVPIGVYGSQPVILADVATVRMGHKKLTSMARYGGQDAVVVLARAKTDIDVLGTCDTIRRIITDFDPGVEGVSVGPVRDQAREIGYMIHQLGISAIYGTILVIFILWVTLGWRNAGLIGISVPFAILGTAAIMWFTKRTIMPDLAINNMTLFAMILVIGMVVDGCIIVGENIYRHRELGTAPLDASKRGIREVGPSLICAYATTFAAFGPMFIVRGVMGDFLELLPIVVLFALCSAMLVDHFLMPVLSMYFMKVPDEKIEAKLRTLGEAKASDDAAQIESERAELAVVGSRLLKTYGNMLRYALHHRLLVLALAVIIACTPIALYGMGAIGVEFFPESDYAIVEVHFELPLGSSMETRTVAVAGIIEQALVRAVKSDEWYQPSAGTPRARPITTIGEPGALNIRLDGRHGTGPEFGMVYCELALAGDRQRTLEQIRQAIVKEIPRLPGVVIDLVSPSEGPPVGSDIIVRVLGREQTTLDELAKRAAVVERALRAIPGTRDVKSDYRSRPEIVVKQDRMLAGLFGLDSAAIDTSINFALEGVRVGEVDFGGDEEIDIRIRNQASHRDEQEDLANLPLLSRSGRRVTLAQVADIDRRGSANVIRHYEQQRVINVRCEVEDGVLVDDVKAELAAAIALDITGRPARSTGAGGGEYFGAVGSDVIYADHESIVKFGGENDIRDDALYDLSIALAIAFGIMLIVLVLKFNSFIQPLIVLFSVPLSLVGVAIGLMICGFYFSVAVMIGVVALAGIVVNDAIVLVDFINRLRGAGIPRERAIVYAGQLRLRPIFLTTITTVGGLLPLALNISGGGEFWQPLTVTIMFGLAFATLLQLFIIPLACFTFDRHDHASVLDPTRRRDLAGADVAPAPV